MSRKKAPKWLRIVNLFDLVHLCCVREDPSHDRRPPAPLQTRYAVLSDVPSCATQSAVAGGPQKSAAGPQSSIRPPLRVGAALPCAG
eukprot:42608-Prymnesium_polylepis.3